MKKSKIISAIVAAVLSAVMLIGCSGGATAVGKKYDAVYAAVDDYVIALDGAETYLYKNDKKVGKNGYYSIELFSSTYTDHFKAKKNAGDETVILLGNDGSAKTLPEEVTELEAEVSGGENGTYNPASGSTVILNNNIYAVIAKDGAAKLWTAAMSEPIDLDPEKSDDLTRTKTFYKINGLPVLADDVKFFDGTASSPAVVDSKFAQIEDYTVDTRYGLNVVARREKYDLLDKDARARMSDYVLQVKLAVFTWEDGGAEKSETYLLYRKSGSGEIYTKVRIGDGKATLGSVNASGVVLVSKDDGKEFYKAILSENGEVANGIAVVYNGSEPKYYGAVKLGKTANKAKLIKKIEYESHKLYSSGDFALGKAGKAGDRERVSKTIVTSTDGKECVITRSAKEKDLGWSVTNVLFGQ